MREGTVTCSDEDVTQSVVRLILKYTDLARAKSEALFNIYSFLKSSNTKDRVKTTETVKNNNRAT